MFVTFFGIIVLFVVVLATVLLVTEVFAITVEFWFVTVLFPVEVKPVFVEFELLAGFTV